MSRRLLLEHNAPLMTRPDQWRKELVTPDPFSESLIESYVGNIENRYREFASKLLEDEQLTEERAKAILSGWKDSFVRDLRESNAGRQRLRVSGPAQVENQRNGNGRMYPTELWDACLSESGDFMTRLRNRQVLGELEHPAEGNTKLPRVSHLVESVWRNEGTVYAQHLIFRTPNGQIIEELYRSGAVPGVSSRGAGSTRNVDGVDVVEANDFHLDTWDFVAQPSVALARPSQIGESDKTTGKGLSETPKTESRHVITGNLKGDRTMQRELVEAANAIASAKAKLTESDRYLNSKKVRLPGLLEHQSALLEAAMRLSESPEGMERDVALLRAELSERIGTLRKEISRIAEDDDEDDDAAKGDDDVTEDDDDGAKGKDDNPFDGGDGDNDGEDETPKKESRKSFAKLMGLKSEDLNSITLSDVVEELVSRNENLRRRVEGQVPEAKYRQAIQLGEAIVARANSDAKAYEEHIRKLEAQLKQSRLGESTAKSLLEATVQRYRRETVESKVGELVLRNPQLKAIESKLRECQTVPEIKRLIEGVVKPLAEGGGIRTDLPPVTLVEQAGTGPTTRSAQRRSGGDLMSMLAESERNGHQRT